jgi:hypothetical protein
MEERSPNETLSLVDQALCAARALMSYDPLSFDAGLEHDVQYRRYATEHGELIDQWFRVVYPDGHEWYILATPEGQGESRAEPPPGQEIAITFTVPGERPTHTRLKKLTEGFVTGSLAFSGKKPTKNDLRRLDLALSACEPGYNERFLSSFAEDPRMTWQSPEDLPKSREEDPLFQYSERLRNLRGSFGADALLFSSFTGAIDICYRIIGAATDTTERTKIYVRYASMMLNSRPDPRWLIQMICWESIKGSSGRHVLDVADKLRDLTDKCIEAALNTPTLNDHLDGLYRALPPCWAALEVYTVAAGYQGPNAPTDSQRDRFRRIRTVLDEQLVRLIHPFRLQVLDFYGNEWRRHREIVRQARTQHGESAAVAAARSFIEQYYFYPRSLRAMLLD